MVFLRSVIVSLLYYTIAIILAVAIVLNARSASDGERALSELDSAEQRTDSLVKQWMERLSFGLYTGASDKARVREQIESAAGYHRHRVNWLAWLLAGSSFVFLILLWFASSRTQLTQRPRMLTHLHGVAAIFLVVGLTAPMLTIIAQSEVAILGQVVLHFEAKSILATVATLAANDHLFVAIVLALFSVVAPALKLALSLAALLAPRGRIHDLCVRIVAAIGKWSMTDVFVVAILLAFLALGDGGFTDAHLGPGLYFFAGYGLLSLIGGVFLARRVQPSIA